MIVDLNNEYNHSTYNELMNRYVERIWNIN